MRGLRASISAFFQDYAVYAFTIYENICLGKQPANKTIEETIDLIGMKKRFVS